MCECVKEMNDMLADHNGGIVTTLFPAPDRACVEVYSLKTFRGSKKPPKVLATFCPFCGERYVEEGK